MTGKARSTGHAARAAIGIGALLLFIGFIALGTWQVQRRTWKLDLISRVDARVHAPAIDAPGPSHWSQVNAANDEYRHVRITGSFIAEATTPVQALSELGAGSWLLTPLREADGSIVLVNRGFVSADTRAAAPAPPAGSVSITGLLRLSEPGGGFLRRNDPAANRWYSRDVAAIAAARGLARVAPYFIDADAPPQIQQNMPPNEPVGGLTVITFHNNHLVYALTWYTLASMVAWGAWRILREDRRAH